MFVAGFLIQSITLDSAGRYLFLSAIANQLRYPNSHTHYFSRTLLYLFADGGQEVIKEQVTRFAMVPAEFSPSFICYLLFMHVTYIYP